MAENGIDSGEAHDSPSKHSLPFNVGDVVDGRWKLAERLGSGSFATVFLASSSTCSALFAVKVEFKVDLPQIANAISRMALMHKTICYLFLMRFSLRKRVIFHLLGNQVAKANAKKADTILMLQKEAKVLTILKGTPGVPEIISSPNSSNYLVSTLLHATLSSLGRRLRSAAYRADLFLMAREAGVQVTVR